MQTQPLQRKSWARFFLRCIWLIWLIIIMRENRFKELLRKISTEKMHCYRIACVIVVRSLFA
jgi:hypothetical protein